MERDYKKESKIKGFGFWVLLIIGLYHNFNGYGSLEMTLAIFIIIIIQMFWNYRMDYK